ncbi:MAG TPA: C40 family peptidase [Candidatus Dormibacteraeota bacterium]|nr:C40 family peptidase [Candidatus Dormibacteraeota bacterium]
MRFAFAAWALMFFAGSVGIGQAAIGAPHVQHASRRRVSAERTSPDLGQWMARAVIVKHVHHAAAIGRFTRRVLARTSLLAQRLTRSALRFLGVPYVFGGTSRAGFDCSGYVQHVFAMLGIHLPRTADAQYYAGAHVRKLRPGDLVFFQTYLPGPSHVGIYLGHGRFVHASSHGVMVSSLSQPYWENRYLGARNLIRR